MFAHSAFLLVCWVPSCTSFSSTFQIQHREKQTKKQFLCFLDASKHQVYLPRLYANELTCSLGSCFVSVSGSRFCKHTDALICFQCRCHREKQKCARTHKDYCQFLKVLFIQVVSLPEKLRSRHRFHTQSREDDAARLMYFQITFQLGSSSYRRAYLNNLCIIQNNLSNIQLPAVIFLLSLQQVHIAVLSRSAWSSWRLYLLCAAVSTFPDRLYELRPYYGLWPGAACTGDL